MLPRLDHHLGRMEEGVELLCKCPDMLAVEEEAQVSASMCSKGNQSPALMLQML